MFGVFFDAKRRGDEVERIQNLRSSIALQGGRISCLHRVESNLSYSLLLNQKPS